MRAFANRAGLYRVRQRSPSSSSLPPKTAMRRPPGMHWWHTLTMERLKWSIMTRYAIFDRFLPRGIYTYGENVPLRRRWRRHR